MCLWVFWISGLMVWIVIGFWCVILVVSSRVVLCVLLLFIICLIRLMCRVVFVFICLL